MSSHSSILGVDYSYWYIAGADGHLDPKVTITRKHSPVNSVTRGEGQANWRQLIANGDNATTGLTGTRWDFKASPASLKHSIQHKSFPAPFGSREVELEGGLIYLGLPPFFNEMAETSANNQALTRYYSAANSLVTKFQGFVFAGELREALNLIRHPAHALRRGIGDYLTTVKRRGRSIPKRKRTTWVRKTWLEYAFGWRPLIADIDNAITAFYSSDLIRPTFEMVHGRGYDEKRTVTDLSDSLDVGAGHIVSWGKNEFESVSCHYYGIYQHSGNGVPNSHVYGFKPQDFIPSLWELIPYSFLVDYFTNIGDIISSWSYRSIGTKWTSKTIRRTGSITAINTKYYCSPTISPNTYFISTQGVPGSSYIEKTNVERFASVTPTLPSLELEVPGMSSTKWLNLLGLSTQLESTRRSVRL
jgi:hypothetical protein